MPVPRGALPREERARARERLPLPQLPAAHGQRLRHRPYFKAEDVEIGGDLKSYEYRSDESGRWLRTGFCARCGTTVTWTAEALPGLRALAGGTFDDPHWLKIDRHGWTRSRHRWFVFPEGVQVFEKAAMTPPAKPQG